MAEYPETPLDLSKTTDKPGDTTMLPMTSGDNTELPMAPSSDSLSETGTEFLNILNTFEELFKDRYTDRDDEFVRHKVEGKTPPPLVKNYFVRQNRSFDRRGGGRGGHRGGGGYRGQGRGYHGNNNRDGFHGGYGNQQGRYNQYPDDRRQNFSNHRQDRRYNPY